MKKRIEYSPIRVLSVAIYLVPYMYISANKKILPAQSRCIYLRLWFDIAAHTQKQIHSPNTLHTHYLCTSFLLCLRFSYSERNRKKQQQLCLAFKSVLFTMHTWIRAECMLVAHLYKNLFILFPFRLPFVRFSSIFGKILCWVCVQQKTTIVSGIHCCHFAWNKPNWKEERI